MDNVEVLSADLLKIETPSFETISKSGLEEENVKYESAKTKALADYEAFVAATDAKIAANNEQLAIWLDPWVIQQIEDLENGG